MRDLLWSYQRLIDEAGRVGREAPLLRRAVTYGTAGWAVEHVRRALVTLDRRYRTHAALAERPEAAAGEGRSRVSELAASLPPPPSRVRALVLAALVLVVGRLLLPLAPYSPLEVSSGAANASKGAQPLAQALTRVSDLDPANLGDAVDVLADTSLLTTWVVVTVFGIAAYVVLRPLATGAVAFRVLRHGSAASRTRWYAAERAAAERLQVDERERAVFDAIGLRAPADGRLDLAAKACLAAPLLLGGVAIWLTFLGPGLGRFAEGAVGADGGQLAFTFTRRARADAVLALVLGAVAAPRLAWLAMQAWRRRAAGSPSQSSPWPALASLGVLTGIFGLLALQDNRPPGVVLAAPPITKQVLNARTFGVRFACSEPCEVFEPRLLDGRDRVPEDAALATPDLVDDSLGTRPPPSLRNELDRATRDAIALPTEPTRRIDVELSRKQTAWLAQELTCPDDDFIDPCGRSLRFRVEDFGGNHTDIAVPLAPPESR